MHPRSTVQREGFRRQLKPFVPRLLWVGARRTASYIKRLRIWIAVLREVRGRTPADRSLLYRSACWGVLAAHRGLDRWQDPVLVADAAVEVPGVGAFNLRANSDDLYHVLPYREPALFREIRQRMHAGATFVDAGANIGIFTVLGGRLAGPKGRVIAVEMMPDTAMRLHRHVALNGLRNVTVIERALSGRGGENVLASMPAGRFGQASIMGAHKDGLWIETVTLDEVLGDLDGTIDLMKVDLEGAEACAFAGGATALGRTRAVIFEQLADDRQVADLLTAAGFAIRRLDDSNLLAERAG